jgi:hypothetical protein
MPLPDLAVTFRTGMAFDEPEPTIVRLLHPIGILAFNVVAAAIFLP